MYPIFIILHSHTITLFSLYHSHILTLSHISTILTPSSHYTYYTILNECSSYFYHHIHLLLHTLTYVHHKLKLYYQTFTFFYHSLLPYTIYYFVFTFPHFQTVLIFRENASPYMDSLVYHSYENMFYHHAITPFHCYM